MIEEFSSRWANRPRFVNKVTISVTLILTLILVGVLDKSCNFEEPPPPPPKPEMESRVGKAAKWLFEKKPVEEEKKKKSRLRKAVEFFTD